MKSKSLRHVTMNTLSLLKNLDRRFSRSVSGKIMKLENKLSSFWYDDTSMAFLTETNIVFLFMVLQEAMKIIDEKTKNLFRSERKHERKTMILASIFLAYSYIGPETGYPFTAFLENNTDKAKFWEYSIEISNKMSGKMLLFNTDFDQIFPPLLKELQN